jgi:hypothetical protein
VNAEVQDRQARLEKIKEALKQLEERKPESESKAPEKDQINFTDPKGVLMLSGDFFAIVW